MITPQRINRKIRLFLEKMGVCSTPIFVNVEPVEWALYDECFLNVQKMVEKCGGKMIVGWAISETSILIEAIYHAVYQTKENSVIDITPQVLQNKKILFVEDINVPYVGATKDNYRLNITDNPIVDDFISINKLRHKIINYKERAYNTKIKISQVENRIIRDIDNIRTQLEYYILNGNYPNSKCFCGGNKKYYECHREQILRFITLINNEYSDS
ncbi:MAG: hypothetical protein LBK00_02885 [Treponema sp.]|nr:hypothetical protein [Treponema sp.]